MVLDPTVKVRRLSDEKNESMVDCLGAALGGDCYWASGLHLYTPLPFLYHRENLMSHVRLHYFLNAGNVFNTQSVRKWLISVPFFSLRFAFFQVQPKPSYLN